MIDWQHVSGTLVAYVLQLTVDLHLLVALHVPLLCVSDCMGLRSSSAVP